MRGILVFFAMISSAALAEQYYCEVDQDATLVTGYYEMYFTVNDFGKAGYQVLMTKAVINAAGVGASIEMQPPFDGSYVRLGPRTNIVPADVGMRVVSNDNVVMVHLMDIKLFNPAVGDMIPVRGSIENTPATGRCKRLQ